MSEMSGGKKRQFTIKHGKTSLSLLKEIEVKRDSNHSEGDNRKRRFTIKNGKISSPPLKETEVKRDSDHSEGNIPTDGKRRFTIKNGKIVHPLSKGMEAGPSKENTSNRLLEKVRRLTREEIEQCAEGIVTILNDRKEGIKTFWDEQKQRLSNSLWKPEGPLQLRKIIANQGKRGKKGRSWFTIEEEVARKKEIPPPLETIKSIPFTRQDEFKTVSAEIFFTEEQQQRYTREANAFRWHLNAVKQLFLSNHRNWLDPKEKYTETYLRDTLYGSYTYIEGEEKGIFLRVPGRIDGPCPSWMEGINKRIARGAIKRFSASLKSMKSNYNNGNCSSRPKIRPTSKKNPKEYIYIEDKQYVGLLKNVKGYYRYGKGKSIRVQDLPLNKGYEITHDKRTNRYFLHTYVDIDWTPEVKCFDKQETFHGENRIIALDPGVRKFMVGYDPTGKSVVFGKGANQKLTQLLYQADKTEDASRIWEKIANLVNELHWKTIKYLTDNYDTILLPDFRISQMVNNDKLPKIVKRLMYMFSFHKFKTRLIFKCSQKYKRLVIVNESYTSKTCGNCGKLNSLGKNEEYFCIHCGISMDRDKMASRNILIKNSHAVDGTRKIS